MAEKRNQMGPIPCDPENHVTEQQVHGLVILKKFGWKLVCIRRSTDAYSTTVLRNKQEGTIGILEPSGILRITSALKIRKRRKESTEELEFKTQMLIKKMSQLPYLNRVC
ncbi:MAG: hypothetical protein KZQ73_11460 [Candidatus Thiodiazotropha sp. (ex Semelilucina semeliformis)]|nr:hypothetical protein [Candidatus Thiodiazotropha sp. (ex Semelilucina semeliformis)]MCU7830307.1 hypothetical protein [Candidatus Thiodiazotropha sp. (ex Myrtea sp. 'scaly one' KF741663)]